MTRGVVIEKLYRTYKKNGYFIAHGFSRDIYGTYAILDRSYILHQYVDLFAHEHQLAFAFTILVLF